MRYALKAGQRLSSVGHTGTGKSYLVTGLLAAAPERVPIVVLDPKGQFEAPGGGWEYVNELPRLWERVIRREKKPELLRLVVRPYEHVYPLQKRSFAPLNDVYKRIYDAAHPGAPVLAFLDDLPDLCDEHRVSGELLRCWVMGRQRQLSMWQAMQRPSNVPRPALSEADHNFIFYLADRDDRGRVGDYTGLTPDDIPGPGDHDFFYIPPGVGGSRNPILVHQSEGDKRQAV